jgi:hypothetical protein
VGSGALQSARLLFGSAWSWLASEAASSAASMGHMGLSAIALIAYIPLRIFSGALWLPRLVLGKTLGSTLSTLLRGFNWTDATVSSIVGLSISRVVQGWIGWFLGFSWIRNLARQAIILATGQNFTMMGQSVGNIASDAIHKVGVPIDTATVSSAAAGLGEIADGVMSPEGSAVVDGVAKIAEAAVGPGVVASVGETLGSLRQAGQEAVAGGIGSPGSGLGGGLVGAVRSFLGPQGFRRVMEAGGLSHVARRASDVVKGQGLGNTAFGLTRDALQTATGAGGLKSVGAKIGAATPEGRMYSTQLRILGVALIAAAVVKLLLAVRICTASIRCPSVFSVPEPSMSSARTLNAVPKP